MKTTIVYFLFTLVLTFLFNGENVGINLFLSGIAFVGFLGVQNPERLKSKRWWLAAGLVLINSFFVFYSYFVFSLFFFILSILFFSAIHFSTKFSLPLGIVQAIQSLASGIFYLFNDLLLKRKAGSPDQKKRFTFLVYVIPVVLGLIFLKLYQSADSNFMEFTQFLTLKWLSSSFLILFFFFTLLIYGLYRFRPITELSHWENQLKLHVPADHSDQLHQTLGLETERKIGTSILVTLNILLLFYNAVDLHFIFIDLPDPEPDFVYSESLHQGVFSLFFSIVLVVLVISILFRGKLNFLNSKSLRILAIVWLVQNMIMVITTSAKNFAYISHWGLTYKRIAIYVALLIGLLGLIFALFKLSKKWSFWLLTRQVMMSTFIVLVLTSGVNWTRIITHYNLTHIAIDKLDYAYLEDMGTEAYPELVAFYFQHKEEPVIKDNPQIWLRTLNGFEHQLSRIRKKNKNTSWLSINMREHTYANRFLTQKNQ